MHRCARKTAVAAYDNHVTAQPRTDVVCPQLPELARQLGLTPVTKNHCEFLVLFFSFYMLEFHNSISTHILYNRIWHSRDSMACGIKVYQANTRPTILTDTRGVIHGLI